MSPSLTEAGEEQRDLHGEGEVSPNLRAGAPAEPVRSEEVSPSLTEAGEEQRDSHGEGEVSPSLTEAGGERSELQGEGGLESLR